MERNFNNGRGFRRFNNQRFFHKKMHDAICSDCGKECKVPFVPGKDAEGNLRPVYCLDCFKKRKATEKTEKPVDNKESEEIQEQSDKKENE